MSQDINYKTKLQTVIDDLSQKINEGIYSSGQSLPSVNQLSKEYTISRDTVFKAYTELKRRGVIDSTPAKGYFVTLETQNIFLFLDTYTAYKEDLYNAMKAAIPSNYKIDLAFHQYNLNVFETVLNSYIGKYSMYIVMNFNHSQITDTLRKIDPAKLLILDWGKYKKEHYSYVCQDFGEAPYHCLIEALPLIKKYENFVYFNPADNTHPESTIRYSKRFCKENNINFQLLKKLDQDDIKKNTLYFVTRQKELVPVLKLIKSKNLIIGKDCGIIAYNDSPLYEVIENGLTVISTDFAEMGRRAAHFINTRKKIQETIPTRLIVRNSI